MLQNNDLRGIIWLYFANILDDFVQNWFIEKYSFKNI